MYFNGLFKKLSYLVLILSLSACSSLSFSGNGTKSKEDILAKEKLYESTKNFSGLVGLYREQLRSSEDDNTRYKLSLAYYQKGDNSSSLLYLEPLLSKPMFVEKAKLLKIKNFISLTKYKEALSESDTLLDTSSMNSLENKAELYNLRGIAFANLKQLSNAKDSFYKAREFFINDVVAINNLAMISIINGDYKSAIELLLPQYLNGIKNPRLVHNLVFALVKNKKLEYAEDIIKKENLSSSPKSLISSLEKTKKHPK